MRGVPTMKHFDSGSSVKRFLKFSGASQAPGADRGSHSLDNALPTRDAERRRVILDVPYGRIHGLPHTLQIRLPIRRGALYVVWA